MIQVHFSKVNSPLNLTYQLTVKLTFENFCSRTLGDLVMTTTYMEQLYTPLTWLGTIYRMTEDSLVDMERMFKLLQVHMCVTWCVCYVVYPTCMEQLYTPLTWLGIYLSNDSRLTCGHKRMFKLERTFKLLQVQICVTVCVRVCYVGVP